MDWEVIFEFLMNKVDVVIIDEFQNLIKEDKNLLHIFQAIIDSKLKYTKMKLFLLGSSISMITSKVLNYKSPLYGRKTGSVELKPVSFFDLREFFPKARTDELVEIYGFADGIPFYLIKIKGEFWKWLNEEIKKEKSFIRDEVDFLMRYEFEDVSTYKLILEAIAKGKTRVGEIKDYIGLSRTDISPYLKNLLEVGMIKRVIPITENIKSRMGRYYLSDNFLKFWFRYVYPNISSIEEGIFDVREIKRDYNLYLGYIFEDVVRQFLVRRNDFKFTKVGKWWYKDNEIDIVTINNLKKEIGFFECKWKNLRKKDVDKILSNLKEKSKFVRYRRKREYFGIICKKIDKKIKRDLRENGYFIFDLDDIEKIHKKNM